MKHKTLQGSFLNYYWINVTERFFDFDGKTSREEFWMFTLWHVIIAVVFSVISVGILGAIYSLLILVPQTAISVRRYHDIGMSGWVFFVFFVLFLIPYVNIIVLVSHLILMMQPGKNAVNNVQSYKRKKDQKEGSSSKEEIIEEVSIDQDKYPNLKKHKRNY